MKVRVRYSHMVGVEEPAGNGAWIGGDSSSISVGFHITYNTVLDSSHHNPTALNPGIARTAWIVVENRVSNQNMGNKSAGCRAVGANASKGKAADVHTVNGKPIDVELIRSTKIDVDSRLSRIVRVSSEDEVINSYIHGYGRIIGVYENAIAIRMNRRWRTWIERSQTKSIRLG